MEADWVLEDFTKEVKFRLRCGEKGSGEKRQEGSSLSLCEDPEAGEAHSGRLARLVHRGLRSPWRVLSMRSGGALTCQAEKTHLLCILE